MNDVAKWVCGNGIMGTGYGIGPMWDVEMRRYGGCRKAENWHMDDMGMCGI